jgi:hypothetical protein
MHESGLRVAAPFVFRARVMFLVCASAQDAGCVIKVAPLDTKGDTSALEDPVTSSWASLVMTRSCEKRRCARSASLLAKAATCHRPARRWRPTAVMANLRSLPPNRTLIARHTKEIVVLNVRDGNP